jgi:tryptophanyl-tRNA synthetase
MARDIAQRFNHLYGEHFVLPTAAIEESVATLPGLDGRKMSKSYDNHIPLFAPAEQLRKLIGGILTDSRPPGEAKETEGSALFQIYQAFATPQETAAMRQAYADGIAWAEAKQLLFERIDHELAPMREKYLALLSAPASIEEILLAGAEKARTLATPFTAELRRAVGLRDLRQQVDGKAAKTVKTARPVFKQYRDSDGKFYFKLLASNGQLLLQSTGFVSPKEAGHCITMLQTQGSAALTALADKMQAIEAALAPDVNAALRHLSSAD